MSRRFGTDDGRIRHWIAPTLTDAAEQMLELGEFCWVLPLGTWLVRDGDVVSCSADVAADRDASELAAV